MKAIPKIQHLSGGIVSEINVVEGDRVAAGQILLRLSATVVQANLSIIENTLAQLYSRRARLRAEIAEEPSFTVTEDLTALTSSKSAKTFIDSEQNLFNSRRNALIGMKKQLATRKLQLADEARGLDVQVEATENELAIVKEDVSKTDELLKKDSSRSSASISSNASFPILKVSRANISRLVRRPWAS